jgi:3-oxoacyl-[acyl-carrier-protein] synthase II
MKRVVITGMAGFSPIGTDWDAISANLKNMRTGIVHMDSWDAYEGLNTRLGAPVSDFSNVKHYTRKQTRSMGRVSLMATRTAELALEDAGLGDDPKIKDGRMGVAYGSSAGTPRAIADFGNMIINKSVDGINATTYIKMMAHTAPVNISVFFGLTGRVYTTSSACTSGSQGLGYAYEAIRDGHQQMMIAGGAEELDATEAAVFDTLFATSTKNKFPGQSPRPFDKDRDGLVIGEGACSMVLESLESALARGAKIHAEIVGFGTNSDGTHVTQPQQATQERAMQAALTSAEQLSPDAIGYISAHGTATDRGDIAETCATRAVFRRKVPISSLKSFTGHTLGACGALEAMVSIRMLNENWAHATANLKNPDPECAELDYIMDTPRDLETEFFMSNNFAFGGINTSLIFRRWQ